MSLAKVAQFLSNTAANPANVDTPESRLMQALRENKTIPLTDVPGVTGLPADRAVVLVEQLRDKGQAVILEQPGGSALFLGLN
jgi:hypothetical protein